VLALRESTLRAMAVGMLLAGCASGDRPDRAGFAPSATVTTLTPGADHWFRLSMEPLAESDGTHVRLRGYVENTYGEAVGRVQLLAQSLDAGGNVVDQKVAWVPGAIPAFDRVYYEIPHLARADRYRVSVWAYERRKFF
jgi:hypothetical protein